MTPEEFSKTVQEMANNNELAQPKTNVKRMKHFYNDGQTAMMNNIRNMINTYGIDQVRDVLKYMIEYGDFNG